jgi:hypothetical protein
MNEAVSWLLDGPPWVQYRTLVDLLGKPEGDAQVIMAREAMLVHPQIQALVAELAGWPGPILKSHKDAKHPLHKLVFLADLGLRIGDPGMDVIVDRILEHQSPEGPFEVLVNLGAHSEDKSDQWVWMLCDAPSIVYALIKFGLSDDPRVRSALDYLATLVQENGWPCIVAPTIKFRGPGRKTDPCPYATLITLKALAQMPDMRESSASHIGAHTLLDLWDRRAEKHPYLFGIGTDFARPKVPLIWYDIVHMLDVLSQFSWLLDDQRLHDMTTILQNKAGVQGRFTPESIWMAWKEWDFGQKREPSRWLTFVIYRVLKRLHRNLELV